MINDRICCLVSLVRSFFPDYRLKVCLHGREHLVGALGQDEGFGVSVPGLGPLGFPSGNHRIEHIETAPPHLRQRFSRESVTASMQPIHMRWLQPNLSDPWSRRLGERRCADAMPSGAISALGARVVLGSDWPVAPFDPRLGLFAARLRRAPDLADYGPIGTSRPLNGSEALRGYTLNAAEAVGRERDLGMLRAGFAADFIAFREDPAACDPNDVLSDEILLTVVNGHVVYEAD